MQTSRLRGYFLKLTLSHQNLVAQQKQGPSDTDRLGPGSELGAAFALSEAGNEGLP